MERARNLPAEMLILFSTLFLLLGTNVAHAIEFNEASAEDKAVFEKILEPVMRVYNLVKYIASAVAAIVLLFAGISWMASGADIRKRDTAKYMMGYVVIGLIVVWVTPYAVNYIVT